jgi:hypothetical protein
MKTTIHQAIIAALYAAIIFGLMWLAYSGGPSDAEMRERCSTPLAL